MEWFMRKVLWLNNNGSVIPGKVLLSWFYPKLESMFGALDARELLIRGVSAKILKYLLEAHRSEGRCSFESG